MTGIQKAYSFALAVLLLWTITFLPETFFLYGNIYKEFPVYLFLEEQQMSSEKWEDPETGKLITDANLEHAEKMAVSDQKQNTKIEGINEIKKEKTEEKTEKNTEKNTEEKNRISETAGSLILKARPEIDLSMDRLSDETYLLNQFYIVDGETSANAAELDASDFLNLDLSLEKRKDVFQILIYHSHSQEAFADSKEGAEEDTIVGIGDVLTELLTNQYGYQVLHIREAFDLMGGTLDRSKAYDYARESIEKILEENPSIEVVIDLHRDGIPENRHLVTEIDGKETAQILFYNGLSYTNTQGKLSYLPNPYIEENLAFSFQMEYGSALYYPGLYRGIYLAGFRYNLHMKPRSLLIEAGAQTNTVQEVRNAMEPLAFLLNLVLTGNLVPAQ